MGIEMGCGFVKRYCSCISNARVSVVFKIILRAIYAQEVAPKSVRILEKEGTNQWKFSFSFQIGPILLAYPLPSFWEDIKTKMILTQLITFYKILEVSDSKTNDFRETEYEKCSCLFHYYPKLYTSKFEYLGLGKP